MRISDLTTWSRMKGAVLALVMMAGGASVCAAEDAATDPNLERVPSRFSIGIGIGGMRSLETYLSPVTYTGASFGAGVWQELPFSGHPQTWRMRFGGEASFASMLNPRGNARKYDIGVRMAWGAERMWHIGTGIPFAKELWLGAGAEAALEGGCGYLPRNGNNPAAARARIGIDLAGSAEWSGRLGRLPFTVGERLSVPTLGLFFSPQYGESYYEIYLGNRSGLVHCGWWGNTGGVRSHFTISVRPGKWGVRLGWLCRLQRQNACSLRTRLLTNALTLELVSR